MSFLDGYSAKLLEYGLGVFYLVAFVIFWKYTTGRRTNTEVKS